MKEWIFRYVLHEDIEAYLALGWVHDNELAGTHHGFYGELMEWKGEGEPVFPNSVAHRVPETRKPEDANERTDDRPQHAD